MKKILHLTKLMFAFLSIMIYHNEMQACGARGKIYVDTSTCTTQGMAKLKLTNHTTAAGTTYTWQQSNDGGLSWNTMLSNSAKDTQIINPFILGRMYRCQSICPSGVAYSDTIDIQFNTRQIDVMGKICRLTSTDNDSLILSANIINGGFIDSAYAKYFKWQSSSTNGLIWDNMVNITSTVKVKFTSPIVQYRAFVSLCPLLGPNSGLPGAPMAINPVSIGLSGSGLFLSNKDCTNDTARLSISNVIPTLKNFLIFKWTDTCLTGASYNINSSDTFLKVKVDKNWRIYTSNVKLCNNFNTIDSIYGKYNMNPVIRNFNSKLNCITEKVVIDYINRDSIRRDFFTYWKLSQNDTFNFSAYNVPIDSQEYEIVLQNNTNDNFRVYSKFCPNSSNILDSSKIVNIKLKIDTGQLKASFLACPNDSVYLKLNNYKDSSSFPLIKRWMFKGLNDNFFSNYTQNPQNDTTASFRMRKGWSSYRKSISLCADKYAKTWSSTEAKTFLPYALVDTIVCTGPMTVRVVSDTVKTVDYTGTTNRSNATFTYQWLKSTNNKATFSIIPAANNANLVISQADKTAFFKRITKICNTASTQDTTEWSNLVFDGPNTNNGKAEIFDEVCLNDSVRICVVNFTHKIGDTATFIWQISDDEITWTNLLTNTSNDSCIKVLVGPEYKYFRRLTYWCPSGVKDSTASTPVVYVQSLPWCEGFTNQAIFGKDVLFNCWRTANPVCGSYAPVYTGGQIWSRTNTGKTGKGMSNWGPAPADPKNPPGRKLDLKLITPAFYLNKGKIYRFSFWAKQDGSNICWDSLYTTWGTSSQACNITNKFGTTLTNFSFDQFNKFWADFIPQDDGIYYFGINTRDKDNTTGQIDFDDVCLKEITSCKGANPVKGTTFAPSKIVDRSDAPSKAQTYDKEKVTHQYCIHDTIMLTYQENNYSNNFDFYGMSYKFYKKREDEDWKINDTFFREDTLYYTKVAGNDTFLPYDKLNCHLNNRNDYHVKNVVVTDTHTWYKIVATCIFDGKEYHADSLLVNGTHGVPYCDDWEGIGTIQQKTPPASNLPAGNSEQIVGKVPGFASCPTCWAAYPQSAPTPGPSGPDITLHSVTLPFRNPPGGAPLVPQLEPDQGWVGNNVVINCDNRNPGLTREVLVMPAMRLYKGRGYRLTFRWADNRKQVQTPWGNLIQDLDSLYVVAVKGNQSGKTIDSFSRAKMIPGSLKRDIKSNYLELGSNKYQTYWIDYMPNDTGTYYFGMVIVAGAANGNPYRFQMDYFCVDTLYTDPNCTDDVKFIDPLRFRASPGGNVWIPGSPGFMGSKDQWCVGSLATIELDFGNSATNAWNFGNKMYWQKNTKAPPLTPNWTTVDSFVPGFKNSNSINFTLSYKYQNYRLVLANKCNTKFDTIGPFNVLPAGGGLPWREHFEQFPGTIPPCWDVYPTCRVLVKSIPNEFSQKAQTGTEYLDMDFITPASANCPMPTVQAAVPPGFGISGGITHRFSFWYKDNGISLPIDSIVAGWDYLRPTDFIRFRLLNLAITPADVVKNSKTNKWRYYSSEVTQAVDTTIHCKVKTFNNNSNKRIQRTLFDDFMMKVKLNTDALVIALDSPDYACDLRANTTVKVSVMNIGYLTLTNIPVKISVNGGTPVSAIVPGNTVPNQVRTIYIPGVDLSAINSQKVSVWTEVPGEEDAYDDTFSTEIIHNEMYPKPTDTIDSVCVCTNHIYSGNSANGMTRWYRTATSPNPFFIGDHLRLDSLCKDTCLYRSTWNGSVCYTSPQNFSFGAPAYSAAAGGLTFDNISRDTILIDSIMVYANTISTAPFNISVSQFVSGFNVPRANSPSLFISKLGKQWLPIKIKIPPGTDYQIRYPGGASLAHLPGFIYIGSGCPSMQLNITGDDAFPGPPTSFKYFFNWKLEKVGCESERTRICFVTIPNPTFKIKDTNRVCSQPEYQVCGPNAPVGSKYTYQWNTGTYDTFVCTGAKSTMWYRLTVTNEFGCQVNDSLNLIVDPSPNFTLGPDTSFCRYSPYTIMTGLNPATNVVTWSDNQSGVNITILNPGNYIATAFNTANFCTARDTIQVNRRELPVFSLGNDRVFCGNNANLQALAPNLPPLSYTWGSTGGPVVSAPGIGKYWVDGVDIYGCKNTDTILANLIQNPQFDLGPDIDFCGSSVAISGPIGKYYYLWNTTSTKRVINVSTPGTYYLTVTDSVFGCSSVDSIKVKFKTVPTFDLGPDVTKCALSHPIIGPAGTGFIYTWKRKNNTIGFAKDFIADTTGVYYLTVSNSCYTYTDSVRITLKTPTMNAIDLLKDTFGCTQVVLRVTSKTDYTNLQWGIPLVGQTSNSQIVNKSGSYSVSLTNECGTATKSVFVRIDTTPTANFVVASYPDCMSVLLTNLSTNGVSYIWQFGDNSTSTTENPLHMYTSEGDYLVTLRAYNSCGFAAKTFPIAKRKIGCNGSVGINSTTLAESQVYIYPNPTKVTTQLIGVGLPNGKYMISIKNLLGQSVYEKSVSILNTEIDEKLDVAKFASGEYIVHISNDTESIVRKLQVTK